jgi:hypothetical protein
MDTQEKLNILKHLDEDPELKKKVLKYTKQGKSLEVAYNFALCDSMGSNKEYAEFEVW